MLPLVQHQVVLLEERLATLADVRSHRALALRMALRVLQQAVLGRKALVAVVAKVRLGLGHHVDQLLLLLLRLLLLLMLHLDLLLLRLMLDLDNRLLLLLLLNVAHLLRLLLLHLVVLHNGRVLLLLWTLLHSHCLAHYLSTGGQDLHGHGVRTDHRGIGRHYRDS